MPERLKISLTVVVAACLSLGFPNPCSSSSFHPREGTPNFDLGVLPIRGITQDREFTLAVLAACFKHTPEGVVEVSIDLPRGLELIEGDTKRSFAALKNPRHWWEIRVRAHEVGEFLIHEEMSIRNRKGAIDVGRWQTKVYVEAERVTGACELVTVERHDGGTRYRYGGRYLVLLESTDPVAAHVATKPIVVERVDGQCRGCAGLATQVVRFVVTVGPNGKVRWPRLDPERSSNVDSRIVSAAQAAVGRWVFSAATYRGVPVAHWALADVRVNVLHD